VKRFAACLVLLILLSALLPMAQAEDVPGAPRDLRAEREGTRIFISWEPPEENVTVLHYNVYRGNSAGDLEFYDSLDGNFTAGYDLEVVRDRTYYYAVSANTTAGEGAMSEVVIVGVPSDEYPVMVILVILTVISATIIFAYWKGRGSERAP